MNLRVTLLSGLIVLGCTSGDPEASTDASVTAPDSARSWDAATFGADHPLLTWEPLNIAHRGGGDERPEHTLLAYVRALEIGANVLELDVHLTADGAVVVIHDVRVDRTTDGEGRVAELTLRELKALDAGYQFLEGDAYPYRGMGLEVPTLQEVFDTFPEAYFAIELKIDDEALDRAVIGLIRARAMERKVTVGSLIDGPMARLRMLAPEVPTTFTANEIIAYSALRPDTEAAYVPPAPIALMAFGSVDAEVVARTHRLGIYLRAYTVDEEADMERLIEVGAMAIITDHPALLQQVFDRRGP